MKTKIKEIRKAKGISQKELAERLHMSPAALSQIERPENNTQLATLERIAAALDCSVLDLIDKETFESANDEDKAKISDILFQDANDRIDRAAAICNIAGYTWKWPEKTDGLIHLIDKKTKTEYAVTDEAFTAAVDGSAQFIEFNFAKLIESAKIID